MKAGIVSTGLPLTHFFPGPLRRGLPLALSRGAAVALQMAVQIALGAVGGPAAIGLLQLHMAWTSITAEVVGAGEATRALRDTALHRESGECGAIGAGLRRSLRRVAAFSLILGLLALLVWALGGLLVDLPSTPSTTLLALAVLCSAPLLASGRIFAEALKALQDQVMAISLENLVVPAVLLLLCAGVAAGLLAATPAVLLAAGTAGLALGLLLLRHRFRHRLAAAVPEASEKARTPLRESREQLFFWLNGLLNILFLQLPFLLLSGIADVEEIARLAVAHKLVNVVTTLLILLAAVYGPRFAVAASNPDKLLRLLAETQWLSLLLMAPVVLCLMLASRDLAALFSLPAESLTVPLIVLGLGQLINAATGLSGVLLTMTGGARQEFQTLLCSILTAAVLILSEPTSMDRVAGAVAAGIALRNLLSHCAARIHLARLSGGAL